MATREYDTANYLDSEEAIVDYLKAMAEDDDPALFLGAVADALKARAILQLAKETGLSRKTICEVLTPWKKTESDYCDKESAQKNISGGPKKPNAKAIAKISKAFGLPLTIKGKNLAQI